MLERRGEATTPAEVAPGTTAGRRGLRAADVPMIAAVAAGGAPGALGRYGLAVRLPHEPGTFPWATFWTNVTGCLLIGIVMVLLTEVAGRPHRLLRPFVGVGILGGFTTFSTYTVDVLLLARGEPGAALMYLFGTLAAALVAVEVGMAVTRMAARARRAGGGARTRRGSP